MIYGIIPKKKVEEAYEVTEKKAVWLLHVWLSGSKDVKKKRGTISSRRSVPNEIANQDEKANSVELGARKCTLPMTTSIELSLRTLGSKGQGTKATSGELQPCGW